MNPAPYIKPAPLCGSERAKAARQAESQAAPANHIKATVKKNQFGEWVCRFWINGIHRKELDYFTDCKIDAHGSVEFICDQLASQMQPAPIESHEFPEGFLFADRALKAI